MLETSIESIIYTCSYRQFKTVVGLNFITSVNCATEISVSAIQTCLNPFVISMLIRKFFFRLREQWMYTSRYTQSPPVDHAPVSYYCCVICVIHGLKLKEKGDTDNYRDLSLFYTRRIKPFSSHQNTK